MVYKFISKFAKRLILKSTCSLYFVVYGTETKNAAENINVMRVFVQEDNNKLANSLGKKYCASGYWYCGQLFYIIENNQIVYKERFNLPIYFCLYGPIQYVNLKVAVLVIVYY